MNIEVQNRIEYTVMCISEFANKNSLHPQKAYCYLKEFGGITFLKDNYYAEHLQSIDDTIEDLLIICKRNGGYIG